MSQKHLRTRLALVMKLLKKSQVARKGSEREHPDIKAARAEYLQERSISTQERQMELIHAAEKLVMVSAAGRRVIDIIAVEPDKA